LLGEIADKDAVEQNRIDFSIPGTGAIDSLGNDGEERRSSGRHLRPADNGYSTGRIAGSIESQSRRIGADRIHVNTLATAGIAIQKATARIDAIKLRIASSLSRMSVRSFQVADDLIISFPQCPTPASGQRA
jgi:hypothetical protein